MRVNFQFLKGTLTLEKRRNRQTPHLPNFHTTTTTTTTNMDGYKDFNPSIQKEVQDVLYHLGLSNKVDDLPDIFGDTKFVCMGGSAKRMEVCLFFLLLFFFVVCFFLFCFVFLSVRGPGVGFGFVFWKDYCVLCFLTLFYNNNHFFVSTFLLTTSPLPPLPPSSPFLPPLPELRQLIVEKRVG